MKLIPLREFPGLKTTEIIKTVTERTQGAMVSEIRARVRVQDALEKSVGPAGLALEDADHAVLVKAIDAFPFGMASKDLLTIIDDILEAKEPPPPSVAPVAEAAA
jgi:hypothetical protein